MSTEFQEQVMATLDELKSYIDRGNLKLESQMDSQRQTVIKASREMERLGMVHSDAAMQLLRSRVLKFARGID